ncbi:MAG: GTP 3',8-cyclase MoaA [Planctomycetota bacterium]|nr:GTP 3',8-cyclase MoaA [Planctomycetota bacterium]
MAIKIVMADMKPLTNPEKLIDSFGRVHNNLRISVTDRCNIRCFYCMPEQVTFMERSNLLTFEEIERFVKVAVQVGINKIRLTGGEPLVRRNLSVLVEKLIAIDGINDVALTTNGVLLADQAQALFDAGLRRINLSLDTLDSEKFKEITRRDSFDQVMEGIMAAKEVGFSPIKLNAVSMRGITEKEVIPLAHFGRTHGIDVRFIEYMPLDADNGWERQKVFFAHEILELLAAEFGEMQAVPEQDVRAPAKDYSYPDGNGRVGIIASVSRPFCATCNRVRLTADGKLRHCLFALQETDIKSVLRSTDYEDRLKELIFENVASKWEGHEINTARFVQPERLMHSIGG